MQQKFAVPLSVFGLIAVILGALVGIKALQILALIASAEVPQEPTTVSVVEVASDTWEQTIPAVGSAVAYQGVTVATEVAGTVVEIAFQAGSEVSAGDLLVRLEDSVEQANLNRAVADLELARKNANRARELRERNSIPQSEVDAAEAAVAIAGATAEASRAQLVKKRILAPFSGRLGIRQISVGQYLSPGSPVVDLRTISPIFVEFSVPQDQLPLLREGLEVRLPEIPDVAAGEVTALATLIDPATRNVTVQATFGNTEGLLRPGMFVKAEVVLPGTRDVLMIPQTGVIYNAYGDSVFLATQAEGGGLVAQQAFVRLGERRGDFVEVLEGLEAGQRIVRAGAFKLRNDMPIALGDRGVPDASLNPTPADR